MESPNKRCICQLCTCGKHSCHQTLKAQDWSEIQPIYQRNARSYLPSIGNNHQFIDSTTYKDHYQPSRRIKTEHHVTFKEDNPQSFDQKQTPMDYLPFIGTTSYRDHYERKYDRRIINIMNPERTSLQPQYIRPNIKFEGQSTYKSHYIDTPYMKNIRNTNSQKVSRKLLYNQQQIAFKGSSTYQDAYQPYIFEVKPISSAVKSPPSLKFEGTSVYHDDYRGYKIRQEINSRCPVESLPVPRVNTTGHNHIYYDPQANRFI